MAVESVQKRRGLGQKILHFSHDLAHGFGEKVAEPAINAVQYDIFDHPEKHRREIDRQMYRTFRRAGSSLKSDNLASTFLFTQFVLAVGFGEHVPWPLQWTPLPHELTAIPLPFNVHIDVPIPPANLINLIPHVHVPTEFKSNGHYWPLFTSDIIMSGAVNFPNMIRAIREKHPKKAAWYGISLLGAFSHLPFIFNSFWWELALRPAERKAGNVFAEKVNYVLEGKDVPSIGILPEPKSRIGRLFDKIPPIHRFRVKSRAEVQISPADRHIFAQAVQNRFTSLKSKEWWIEKLHEVELDIKNDRHRGLPHSETQIQKHEAGRTKSRFPTNLWHILWEAYHKHMKNRLEEKEEAIQTARDFIHLSGEKPKYKTVDTLSHSS